MYDVDILEKKWKKYQFRRKIPWIASAFLVFLTMLYLLFRADMLPVLQKYTGSTKSTIGTIKEQEARKISSSSQGAPQSIRDAEEEGHSLKSTEIFHPELLPSGEHKRKYLKIVMTERYPQKSHTVDAKSKRTIEKLKERFVNEGSYDASLRLARIYYEEENYSEAEHWALITNDLNSTVEKSWLIFANSQVKQGEIDKAVKTLSVYIKKTGSLKAKELLRTIEEGNF